MTHSNRRTWAWAGAILLAGLALPGCQSKPSNRVYVSPYPASLAVVPFKNLSGSQSLETLAVTDEFVTELGQVSGLTVMPLNQVLAKLRELQMTSVSSPSDALMVADAMNVDGVIVGAVHRWEPYDPPLLGMAVQLYLRDQVLQDKQVQSEDLHVNPADLSRASSPYDLKLREPLQSQSEVTRVYDASQDWVIEKIKAYALLRPDNPSPMGWKRYKTQRLYLRFVSYEIVGELMLREHARTKK
jgi:hypothetical protein